uniref:Carboxylesterase type B domain-containing protein n=1 Tax=Bionectria ochroleuca TaxID=29856 RepID=A0A0B7KBU5_BIOOC
MIIGLVLVWLLSLVTGTTTGVCSQSAPKAIIPQGTIQGFHDSSCNSVFLGIPFAATTGGQNRWRPPQPLRASTSLFKAETYGPTCPQAVTNKAFSKQDEDCLNLNIWAPSSGENLPLKAAHPSESQNFSILDVEKALQWVRNNIKAFGGDPDHIVFGGHSSGSVQVDHYLWNHPKTWLKGAIMMSAIAVSGPAYSPINEALDAVSAEVRCPTGGKGQIECLRNIDFFSFETANFNSTFNTWFTPVVDNITRFSDYTYRFAKGEYASHVSLITGNSNGEGTVFSIVYGSENTDFKSWIKTFDADSAFLSNCSLIHAYSPKDFASESLRSGAQYGDARFNCPVDYLVDMRSEKQDTWLYRFYGKYDNVVGLPNTAPTHGTEVPFFHGGNECFDSLAGVTASQQALANHTHQWFVKWIKNPAAGPGWAKASPKFGAFAKLGVPGNELAITVGNTNEYNLRCQAVYNHRFSHYAVIQSVLGLANKLNP